LHQKQTQEQRRSTAFGEEPLANSQIDEMAQELGIDPSFVKQTLSQHEAQSAANLDARLQKLTLARRQRMALPALLALLALIAIPTGQLFWLLCLGFLPFLIFMFPPLKLESGYWHFRCPHCGTIAGRYFRGGAASRGKRTLGKCPQCNAMRWFIVEPEPTPSLPESSGP